MLGATAPWIAFRAAVLDRLEGHPHAAVIRENLSYDWPGTAKAIEAALAAPIPAPPDGAQAPDPPLHRAVLTGDMDAFRDILARSPDQLRLSTHRGDKALHLAVEHHREAFIAPLLEAGADPSEPAKDGDTPLHRAASRRAPAAIVEALLAHGASIDALDARGWTPLQVAALAGLYGTDRKTIAGQAPRARRLARPPHRCGAWPL